MLSIVEGRVLGCLMEKERTVPDQYPLTMNALLSACNQSTSRDPVMRLGEHEVLAAITSLKGSGFARLVHPSHGRSATRYRHVADEQLGLDAAEAALVSVLLLRGPQTLSELRTRTERQHAFTSLDEVDESLHAMAARGLVRLLGRQPGQKELRWQQLVAEEAEMSVTPVSPLTSASVPSWTAEPPVPQPAPSAAATPAAPRSAPPDAGPPSVGAPADGAVSDGAVSDGAVEELTARVAELEARVARLESALADLL